MPRYVIGDVQGCYDELCDLLEAVAFDESADELCFAGDLVNRGPGSLQVLRLAIGLGDRARAVLGNHDLHLLAAASGARAPRRKDTFDDVLDAPERDALLDWVRAQPLLDHDVERGYAVVHAGIPPQWSLAEAVERAGELESVLRGPDVGPFLHNMYGNGPERWSEELGGWDRLRYITNAFTRMRYVDRAGALNLEETGPPQTAGALLTPWYAVEGRRTRGTRIVFGHWATLQTLAPLPDIHGVHHLDTGCVWGGALTALRLDDGAVFSVPSRRRHARRGI